MGTVVNIGMFSGHASFSSIVQRPKGVRRGGRAVARRAARASIAGDPRTSIRGASSAPVKSAPAARADDEDAWLGILRDAVARE